MGTIPLRAWKISGHARERSEIAPPQVRLFPETDLELCPDG